MAAASLQPDKLETAIASLNARKLEKEGGNGLNWLGLEIVEIAKEVMSHLKNRKKRTVPRNAWNADDPRTVFYVLIK